MQSGLSFRVHLENTQEVFQCNSDENVLQAMERLRRKGIPVGCRNGGCGVCKVRVMIGQYRRVKMSRAACSAQDEADGFALACRIHPLSDLSLCVVGQMVRAFQTRGTSFDFGFAAMQLTTPDREK